MSRRDSHIYYFYKKSKQSDDFSVFVNVDVLRLTLLVSINDIVKAHGIVEASLDITGSSGSGTVEITDSYKDRLSAALEVRTYGSNKNTELVLFCGSNTDNRA